ncbi:unnamed protein product [Lactuca virosa]|uniref:TAZ-type domain-containing protein n=1 Tax=Lactuca virosa TaxID=75947 RepID=A0AAU9NRV5_9ASTR|nr:unnamed protein product [Lactuca virosa]
MHTGGSDGGEKICGGGGGNGNLPEVRGDFSRAEEYCTRAILANPSDENALSLKRHRFQKTEGWKFLQTNDPFLELETLQVIDESESLRKRSKKRRKEQNLYLQLSEAMDCLEYICTEGCISVGPCNKEPTKNMYPCSKFSTCQGLQLSIQHVAHCKKRMNGGCVRCKRRWQLFKLHSSICELPDSTCKVPLCS